MNPSQKKTQKIKFDVFFHFELFTILSIAAVDRSFGVVGENNVDNVDVLFANESPIELCLLSVPIL
jgi:hypothetical protein